VQPRKVAELAIAEDKEAFPQTLLTRKSIHDGALLVFYCNNNLSFRATAEGARYPDFEEDLSLNPNPKKASQLRGS
jgi:hypothetical protein